MEVESDDTSKLTKFEIELDFVQSLANPQFLHYLAQHKYFEDERFLAYLDYLEYWRTLPYLKFLTHPACLYYLKLLKNPEFRSDIAQATVAKQINDELYFTWKEGTEEVETSMKAE